MEPLRQPVVLVEIEGDRITLNGALADRTEGDLWAAAIEAVCATVAAPLGRPVWALVAEAGGQTRVAVHPDGTVSHLQSIDPPLTAEAPVAQAPVVQAPVVEAPVVEAPVVEAPVVLPSHDELRAFLARSAQAAQKQLARRAKPERSHDRAHRGLGRPHPVLRRATPVLGVAALVTVGLAAALLVTHDGASPQPESHSTTTAAEVKDVLPAAHRAKLRDRFPRDLEVHVVPHGGSVEIRVEASRLPVRALIVLDPAAGRLIERRLTLHRPVTRLSLDEVPAGRADWVVRVAGARTESGSVRIPEAPTPTTANALPDPPPEPARQLSPKPTRTAPSEPLTPIDPDEPTGPVDPDDL